MVAPDDSISDRAALCFLAVVLPFVLLDPSCVDDAHSLKEAITPLIAARAEIPTLGSILTLLCFGRSRRKCSALKPCA